jgi:hypothetical protein
MPLSLELLKQNLCFWHGWKRGDVAHGLPCWSELQLALPNHGLKPTAARWKRARHNQSNNLAAVSLNQVALGAFACRDPGVWESFNKAFRATAPSAHSFNRLN